MTPAQTAALVLLRQLGEKLLTQDNAITAEPVFCVQKRNRLYGIDPQYDQPAAWLHSDEYVEADEETSARLEAQYAEDGEDEPEGYRRQCYHDFWEFERAFFTRAAAEQYIRENRHNLTEPRVYVHTGYRNYEWIALRAAMIGLAKESA